MKTLLVLFASLGVIALIVAGFAALWMFFFGAVFGFFGLLQPLGLVDSGIMGALSVIIGGMVFGVKFSRSITNG